MAVKDTCVYPAFRFLRPLAVFPRHSPLATFFRSRRKTPLKRPAEGWDATRAFSRRTRGNNGATRGSERQLFRLVNHMRHDSANLFGGSLALPVQLLLHENAFAFAFQLRELTLVQIIQRGLHGNDPVAERAVVFEMLLRDDGGALRFDKHLLLQLADVLADRVATHAGRLGDLVRADDAVEGFAVLAFEQVGVDRERARREMELKDLHRQREKVFGILPAHPAERDALAAVNLREPTARERTQMFAHGVLTHVERATDAAAGLADERRDEEAEIREVCEDHQRARSQRVVEQTIRQREVILERAAPGVWVVGQVVTSFLILGSCLHAASVSVPASGLV